jgi:hypothetical protein
MRPRVGGPTAQVVLSFKHDDETMPDAVERLIRNPLDKTDLMATMESWGFPEDLGFSEQLRPRLGDDVATQIEDACRPHEQNADAIDRLLFEGEWNGIDTAGFAAADYGETYEDSLEDFAAWYSRSRPPTAYDVEAWLAEMETVENYQRSTLRLHYHAIQAYFKYEIGDWNASAPTPTGDELIDYLQDLADELGKTPTTRDVQEVSGPPGVHHYQDEYGTWNAALREAGFEPNEEKAGEYSTERLKKDLREFAAEVGDVPTSTQMMEVGPHSTSTYITRFGSWSEALEAAGLSVDDRYTGQIEANG